MDLWHSQAIVLIGSFICVEFVEFWDKKPEGEGPNDQKNNPLGVHRSGSWVTAMWENDSLRSESCDLQQQAGEFGYGVAQTDSQLTHKTFNAPYLLCLSAIRGALFLGSTLGLSNMADKRICVYFSQRNHDDSRPGTR